jgi:transposase
MRKRYDKEFKAKVALEAVKGEKTIQDIAMLYQVHPNLVALWKKQLLEHAMVLFEKEGKDKEAEEAARKEEELYRQIGQLQVENEFLKKKFKQLYGTEPKW